MLNFPSILKATLLLTVTIHAATVDTKDPGGVLSQLTFIRFPGSGTTSIEATATDANGNLYVAGTTSSLDFAVKNAAQPKLAEARILRSTDAGATWTPLGNPPEEVQSVAVSPLGNVIYAGGVAGIYRSADSGATWRTVFSFPLPINYSFAPNLVIDPANPQHVAASIPAGTGIRSLDGGATWTPLTGKQFVADPGGSGALVSLGSASGVSLDWGATFRNSTVGAFAAAAFDPLRPGIIYVVANGIRFTNDYGATWMQRATPPTQGAVEALAVDPDQPDMVYAASNSGVFQSSDGARTWTKISEDVVHTVSLPKLIALSRKCSGGGIFSASYFLPGFNGPIREGLRGATGIFTGSGCAVFTTKPITSDAFLAKFDSAGAPLWTTYFGGTDSDQALALAVDSIGSVTLVGSTLSRDLPGTAPAVGPLPFTRGFVARFSVDGKMMSSFRLRDLPDVNTLAMDPAGNSYVAGMTSLTKIRADGSLAYTLDLPEGSQPAALVATRSGELYLGGSGSWTDLPALEGKEPGYLVKLDSSGQTLKALRIGGTGGMGLGFQGPGALALDPAENILIAGTTNAPDFAATPGAYVSTAFRSTCFTNPPRIRPSLGTLYITKLRESDWTPIYTAILDSTCGAIPKSLLVDSAGAVTFSVGTGPGFPTHNPLFATPCNQTDAGAVAKLSPDGSSLLFSTFLDACYPRSIQLSPGPSLAFARDGRVYVGVSHGDSAGILLLDTNPSPPISLDQVVNAFSGTQAGVYPGGLFSLLGPNVGPSFTDLGLNAKQDLPLELNGTRVTFDGIPAAILQTGPNRVIAIAPAGLSGYTAVQVSNQGVQSNLVLVNVIEPKHTLLARDFPGVAVARLFPDGNIRNADGTANDAQHPAAAGSTVNLFAMGLAEPDAPSNPAAIAQTVTQLSSIYTSWSPTPVPIYSMPGFISALYRVPVPVPASFATGTSHRVGVSLPLLFPDIMSPNHLRLQYLEDGQVGIYVK